MTDDGCQMTNEQMASEIPALFEGKSAVLTVVCATYRRLGGMHTNASEGDCMLHDPKVMQG